MAYIDIHNLRYASPNLKARVAVAISKAAQDVLNEDGGTANHANRVVWAKSALADATTMAEKMLWGVVGNASIQAAGEGSTDNDIQFVVNGLVNTFAVGA